jgi:hypothetical protein
MTQPQPDSRMAIMTVHEPGGLERPMRFEDMVGIASDMPTTASTPDRLSTLLKTSRDLLAFSFYVYEFGTVGAATSLQAIEAALREKLAEERFPFVKLIDRAASDGLMTADQAESLDTARQLRNRFSHPRHASAMTTEMCRMLIEVSHLIVAHLYPDHG